ncbi:MAG: metal-sulfur cluster biosynthetic enzyme [Rhodothermales bacterium]|jgi:metal-sulfur cluster biosynthetic enzyme
MIFASKPEEAEVVELNLETALEILRPIIDPDINVSIVDLGLIYDVRNTDGDVVVDMTMTTPACPHAPQLVGEVEYMMRQTAGVKSVQVDIVWDPPWSMDKISQAVRLELGLDI